MNHHSPHPEIYRLAVVIALCVALVCLCGLTGCQSDRITIPAIPAWEHDARTFTAESIRSGIRRETNALILTSDAEFTPMTDAWVDAALKWSWHFSHATGIAYTREAFDCDKFAKAFSLAAEIAASKAGVEAQPLIARIYVTQNKSALGIDATGGGHALNAVLTQTGIWVIEPQTRRKVKLEDYPNRDNIWRVQIGG